jgi:hypothetical protein
MVSLCSGCFLVAGNAVVGAGQTAWTIVSSERVTGTANSPLFVKEISSSRAAAKETTFFKEEARITWQTSTEHWSPGGSIPQRHSEHPFAPPVALTKEGNPQWHFVLPLDGPPVADQMNPR